jgi:glycosyltransferase involved in cell wall biosynthesis
MLRVAHFIHCDGAGGGPFSVSRQAVFFRDRFDVCVLHGARGVISKTCDQHGIKHIQLPVNRFWKTPWGFFRLVHELVRLKPDILLLHGQWAGPMGVLAGYLARVRRMVYVARWPAFYTNWDLLRMLRNDISERVPCRLADKIVVLSPSSRYRYLYRRMAPPGKFVVIPNPIPPEILPSAEQVKALRRRHGWADDECHVVCVGRLASQKQVDWLLQSWRLVLDSGVSKVRLWIIGDGETGMALRELACDLALGDSCVFLGARPDGAHYVAAADIVAMTSMYESFGNVVVEAFLAGKPIVASAVDGIRDALTDGVQGFLVRPADNEGFARRLLDLIRDPGLRARMGSEGRKTVADYDPATVFSRYENLFRELLPEEFPAVSSPMAERQTAR